MIFNVNDGIFLQKMETFIPHIKSSKIYSYFVWVVQMFHQQTLHNIILWFLSARDSPTWSRWSLSNPKFCQTWRHPVLLNVTESIAWFEDKRVKVVDQYSVAKTSLVVHASSLQTEYGEKIGQECTLAPDCQLISLWEK